MKLMAYLPRACFGLADRIVVVTRGDDLRRVERKAVADRVAGLALDDLELGVFHPLRGGDRTHERRHTRR
jgi:hypothetical protein